METVRLFIDHIYDRYGRWNDDALPSNLGASWSVPVYESDLRIEGGNFIADGMGTGFITERVIEQNAGYLTEQEVYDRLSSYCGIDTTHVLEKLDDGTGHIDMFAKLLDEDTMLIAQYDPGDPEYTILENNATMVASLTAPNGNPYEVVRIPMPGSPSAYWTYTNSIIVNSHVYVPVYNDPLDTQALAIYQTAMPDHTIVGIDASSVIGSGGAVHCTTKVVPTAAEYMAGLSNLTVDDSSGDNDGLMDPGETMTLELTLANLGVQDLSNVSGELSCQEPDFATISITSATWPDIPGGQSMLSQSPHFEITIDATTPEGSPLHFSLTVTADNYTDSIDFVATVTSNARAFFWNMDSDPQWQTEGDWAWGEPQGNDGDPSNGYTGSNVYGYNLAGDYSNNLSPTNLTTNAIDCSDLTDVSINFMRWLGVESASYDHASFEASDDGSVWTTIWEHDGGTLSETSWTQTSYDVSQIADGCATVYFRWVMGSTDSSVTYCGWNIDDVEIWGVSTSPLPTATPDICIHSGDTNLDGTITAGDAQMAFQIALGAYSPTTEEACAADCNGDDSVTAGDAQGIFQAALGTGSCAEPIE